MPSLLGLIPVPSGAFDGYSIDVGRPALPVCVADTARTSLTVRNNSNLYPVRVGPQATVEAGGGFPLMPGQSLTVKVTGVLYAVVVSDQTVQLTATLGIWWER